MNLLDVKAVKKSFEKFQVLNGINLVVSENELLAIIGPNGTGKTTLFNLITGFVHPDSGEIYFKGKRITHLRSHEIVKRGISRAFQIVNIFKSMTVLENIRMGILSSREMTKNFYRNAENLDEINEEAFGILSKVGLMESKDLVAGLIPHGSQKSLEIGIALSHKADLLLLDEPTSGMNPEDARSLMKLVDSVWRENRISIMLVEHDMDVVFGLAKRIVVMYDGEIIADGIPDMVRNDENVRRVYLGV